MRRQSNKLLFIRSRTLKARVSRLACGDVEGKISALFNRVQAIQKKTGQFDVSVKCLEEVEKAVCKIYQI